MYRQKRGEKGDIQISGQPDKGEHVRQTKKARKDAEERRTDQQRAKETAKTGRVIEQMDVSDSNMNNNDTEMVSLEAAAKCGRAVTGLKVDE